MHQVPQTCPAGGPYYPAGPVMEGALVVQRETHCGAYGRPPREITVQAAGIPEGGHAICVEDFMPFEEQFLLGPDRDRMLGPGVTK